MEKPSRGCMGTKVGFDPDADTRTDARLLGGIVSPKCLNGDDAGARSCSVWGLSGHSGCLRTGKMTLKCWRGH